MKLATFDLNLLKAADSLLTERSVTRAAERNGVTQQAMSGQLKRLRELFNDALLVQTGRSLLPTPLAQALAQPIKDVLLRIERTLSTEPLHDPLVSKRIFAVAAMTYIGSTLVPAAAAVLYDKAPHARLSVQTVTPHFVEDLKEGRADVCIINRRWRENLTGPPQDVLVSELFTDDYVCVMDASAGHPEPFGLTDYMAARHAVVDLGSGGLLDVQRAWVRDNLEPTISVIQPTFTDVLLVLPGTRLVATVQRRLAQRWAGRLGLSVREMPFVVERVGMEMLWHTRDDGDPSHSFFRDVLRTTARGL